MSGSESPETLHDGMDRVENVEDVKKLLAGGERLRRFDEDGDRYSSHRYRQFVLFVIVPTVLICLALYWVFLGPKGSPAYGMVSVQAVRTGTPVPGASPGSRNILSEGGNFAGQAIQALPSKIAVMVSTPAPERVRCYALRDGVAQYGSGQFLKGGLIWAERWTRVNGGMVYVSSLGWVSQSMVYCYPGLENIEMPFDLPTSTRVFVPRVGSSSTPISNLVVLPTLVRLPTVSGLVSFQAMGCDTVVWYAWDVREVYLVKGGQREAVPGDNAGQPVIRSVCPYTGTLGIVVVGRDGQVVVRSVPVQ